MLSRSIMLAILLASCGDESMVSPTRNACFDAMEGEPLALSSLALGDFHGCGLRPDGTAACWGAGGPHQHGGLTVGQAAPPIDPFESVSAEGDATCAIQLDGEVVCWGQISAPPGLTLDKVDVGRGSACGVTRARQIVCWPGAQEEAVSPIAGEFVDVAVGAGHGCAIAIDGSIACWGGGSVDLGQTTPPPGMFSKIFATGSETCAIDTDGAIRCFGGESLDPAPAGRFTTLALGGGHACALAEDGSLVCWGAEESAPSRYSASNAPAPSGIFREVAIGAGFACVRRTDDVLYCWGAGEVAGPCTPWDGQCGQAIAPRSTISICVPTAELEPRPTIATSFAHSCFMDGSGKVTCWGAGRTNDGCGQSDCGGGDSCSEIVECGQSAVPAESRYARLVTGGAHTCMLDRNGEPQCFGAPPAGAVPPGPFADLGDFLGAGCGIRPDGRLSCFGENGHGEAWPPAGAFREVASSDTLTCAIGNDGEIVCFGFLDVAEQPPSGSRFSKLRVGDHFACVMDDDTRRLRCWSTLPDRAPPPPDVPLLDYDVGERHGCGIREDDRSLICWTNAIDDEGKTAPPPGEFELVSVADGHSCAVDLDGKVACWGDDGYGQSSVPSELR